MAVRTVKIPECDRFKCRSKKDIEPVTVTISVDGVTTHYAGGDLCPKHRGMLFCFVVDCFENHKKYETE